MPNLGRLSGLTFFQEIPTIVICNTDESPLEFAFTKLVLNNFDFECDEIDDFGDYEYEAWTDRVQPIFIEGTSLKLGPFRV